MSWVKKERGDAYVWRELRMSVRLEGGRRGPQKGWLYIPDPSFPDEPTMFEKITVVQGIDRKDARERLEAFVQGGEEALAEALEKFSLDLIQEAERLDKEAARKRTESASVKKLVDDVKNQ